MRRARALFWGLLALGAALPFGTASTLAQAQEAAPAPAPAAARQVLVMLRLPAPHFRPNGAYSGAYGDKATSSARRRIAQRIAHSAGFELEESWPMPLLGVDCFVMRVPDGMNVEDAVARLSADPQVLWAQPMQVYRTLGTDQRASDPLFPVQPAGAAWRLAELHRVATGRGVTVAVIDSRVETAHPDLAGQFAANRDFVVGHPGAPERHGTGIAGVIGAKADNGLGIAGVAPGARMMALRACWQTAAGGDAPTLCDTLSLAKALHFAIDNGVEVINLSLAGPPDPLLARLVDIAVARNISVVAAYDPQLPKGGFPASEPGVVPVADQALPSRPIAVYGAPGRDVPTTQPGGKWYFVNGSSYAVAHVSGLLALARQEHKGAPPRLATAPGGNGAIDACATVFRLSSACGCNCAIARSRGKRR